MGILRECEKSGQFSQHDLAVLQGPLNFAEGDFSWAAQSNFRRTCWSHYDQWKHSMWQVKAFIDSACRMLESLKPRIVNCFEVTAPLVIYTDAAFEKDVACCYLGLNSF